MKTNEELLELRSKIESDPDNAGTGIHLYNEKATKKINQINIQIAHNIKMKKKKAGIYINEAGYSGRQKNRR